MTKNFGDFQWSVYGDAVRGITSRFPFDFESIERKAIDALAFIADAGPCLGSLAEHCGGSCPTYEARWAVAATTP